MAVTFDAKIGENTFHVDGDFEFNEFLDNVFMTWAHSLGTLPAEQGQIDVLAAPPTV